MKDDFLIVSGVWHDGLHYSPRRRAKWGALGLGFLLFIYFFNMGISFAILSLTFFFWYSIYF